MPQKGLITAGCLYSMWIFHLGTKAFNFVVFFLVPDALLPCCVVVVAELENGRVPSSDLYYTCPTKGSVGGNEPPRGCPVHWHQGAVGVKALTVVPGLEEILQKFRILSTKYSSGVVGIQAPGDTEEVASSERGYSYILHYKGALREKE